MIQAKLTLKMRQEFGALKKRYASASSAFQHILRAYRGLSNPTTAQRIAYLIAKDKYSQECREYHKAIADWRRKAWGEPLSAQVEELEGMSLEAMASQIATPKEIAREAQRQKDLEDLMKNPQMKEAIEAALKHDNSGAAAPKELEGTEDMEVPFEN